MENREWSLEKVWSAIGWGLIFILAGILIFADNKGWTPGGVGWLYFAIGLGGIFIIGFLARYLANRSHPWSGFGGLMVGIALVYIGVAFLYGFGDWWPLVLIPIGVAFLVKGIWRHSSQSYIH